jgi:hypothetical protein
VADIWQLSLACCKSLLMSHVMQQTGASQQQCYNICVSISAPVSTQLHAALTTQAQVYSPDQLHEVISCSDYIVVR